jgi:hypothetical protein
METKEQDHRTIGVLLRELLQEARDLFKQEVALAKTETSQKVSVFGRNVGYLAAGGAVALAGALILLAGLSVLLSWIYARAGVSEGVAAWLGPMTVGVIVTVVGSILVSKALKTLKDGSLKPEETIRTLKEDKQWAEHQLQRA